MENLMKMFLIIENRKYILIYDYNMEREVHLSYGQNLI